MASKKLPTTVHKVASGAKGVASAANALAVITEAIDFFQKREEQRTKRAYIEGRRDVLVTAFEAKERVILSYFDQRFAERKGALEQFYVLLHRATESGDKVQLEAALEGTLGIVKDNPLMDFESFVDKWSDPDFVIEL